MGVSKFTYDRPIPRLTIVMVGSNRPTKPRRSIPGDEVMNPPRQSPCSVEPGPKSYEGDDSYPDAPMRKFSRSVRAPVEIAIDVAIDAAVITAIVAAILLVNTPWLLR